MENTNGIQKITDWEEISQLLVSQRDTARSQVSNLEIDIFLRDKKIRDKDKQI